MARTVITTLGVAQEVKKILAAQRKRAANRGLTGGWEVSRIPGLTQPWEHDSKVELVITGSAPKIKGWEILAVYDRVGDDLVVFPIAGDHHVGAESLSFDCDHCGQNRQRNHMVLIQNKLGTNIQLGTACAKDYLGWSFQVNDLLFPPDLDALFAGEDADDLGFGGTPTIWTHEIVARSFALIETFGWHPKSQPGQATADMLFNEACWRSDGHGGDFATLTSDHFLKASEALQWAHDKDTEGNDYLHNLKVLAKQDTVTERHIGLLASLASAWLREKKWTADRKTEASAPAELFAPVKTRFRDAAVTVLTVREIETYYGLSMLYVFQTESGHLLKWFSSRNLGLDTQDKGILTATVKEEDTYRGIFYTTITRGKFTKN